MKKMIITGNVGKDPEIRATQAGKEFASFSVGVSVGTKQNPKTDWVEVSCNDKLVDLCRSYIRKGSKLLIEGFPSVEAYISKQTSQPVGKLKISAHTIEFIGSKASIEGGNEAPSDETPAIGEGQQMNGLNDIPF